MVNESFLDDDGTAKFQSQSSSLLLEQGETAFEIIGMEMLLRGDGSDDIRFSDGSSSSDSDSDDSYAKDSLELARQNNQRGRRTNRLASSNDSYAKDSLELAKKTRIQRSNTAAPKKDTTTPPVFETIIPLVVKNGSTDIKNIQPQAFETPDISALRPVRISNSAA
jgi:hypothetical protein